MSVIGRLGKNCHIAPMTISTAAKETAAASQNPCSLSSRVDFQSKARAAIEATKMSGNTNRADIRTASFPRVSNSYATSKTAEIEYSRAYRTHAPTAGQRCDPRNLFK